MCTDVRVAHGVTIQAGRGSSSKAPRLGEARTRRPALVVVGVGATVAACGLDVQGTEFAAPVRGTGFDASPAAAGQSRPDAMYADAASLAPPSIVAEAGTSAAGNGAVFEASVVHPVRGSPLEATPLDEASLGDDGEVDSSPAGDTLAMALESGLEGATSPSSCDQDGDGYLAKGAPCFGNDCCDTDPNVHPGQTEYFTSPTHWQFAVAYSGVAMPSQS